MVESYSQSMLELQLRLDPARLTFYTNSSLGTILAWTE